MHTRARSTPRDSGRESTSFLNFSRKFFTRFTSHSNFNCSVVSTKTAVFGDSSHYTSGLLDSGWEPDSTFLVFTCRNLSAAVGIEVQPRTQAFRSGETSCNCLQSRLEQACKQALWTVVGYLMQISMLVIWVHGRIVARGTSVCIPACISHVPYQAMNCHGDL